MADFTSTVHQAATLRALAQDEQRTIAARNAARRAAYRWFVRSPEGQLILEDMVLATLLTTARDRWLLAQHALSPTAKGHELPPMPQEEHLLYLGEVRFVQRLLATITQVEQEGGDALSER